MGFFQKKIPDVFIKEWFGVKFNIVIESSKIILVDKISNDIVVYENIYDFDFHGGISLVAKIKNTQYHKISIIPYRSTGVLVFNKMMIIGEINISGNPLKRFVSIIEDRKIDNKHDDYYYYSVNEYIKLVHRNSDVLTNWILSRHGIEINNTDVYESIALGMSILILCAIILGNVISNTKQKDYASQIIAVVISMYDIYDYISNDLEFTLQLTKDSVTPNDLVAPLTIILSARLNLVVDNNSMQMMNMLVDDTSKYLNI